MATFRMSGSRTSSAIVEHAGSEPPARFPPFPTLCGTGLLLPFIARYSVGNLPRQTQRDPCGAEGTRTPCLYSAIVALSQMSYSPAGRVQYIPKQGLVSNRLGKSGARLPT